MPTPAKPKFTDSTLIALAREFVMDVHDPETILKLYDITPKDWESIQQNKTFQNYVRSFKDEWNSALNTEQRVKIKSAVLIEQWLSEAYRLMWLKNESLNSRTELAKLVAKLAGGGFTNAPVEGNTEAVKITINLGNESPIQIEKDVSATSKVIEHDKK